MLRDIFYLKKDEEEGEWEEETASQTWIRFEKWEQEKQRLEMYLFALKKIVSKLKWLEIWRNLEATRGNLMKGMQSMYPEQGC